MEHHTQYRRWVGSQLQTKFVLCAATLLCVMLSAPTCAQEVCTFNASEPKEESKRLCEGGSGTLLPLFPTWEAEQDKGLRVFIYLVGLLWTFAGVALLADAFMGAIEVITSEEVTKNDGIRDYKVLVWNPTVANLTLMALGSSAPEIVLAIIEIAGNEMFTGELGPSTIVGSAAFNLLVILGVCIISIPTPENDPHSLGYRRVKQRTVLMVTSFNSIFAYIWLLVILMGTSPDLIEPWEGIMTFMFCPIMVIIAYLADKGYFTKDESEVLDPTLSAIELTSENITEVDVYNRLHNFAKHHNKAVTDLDERVVVDFLMTKDVGNVRQTRAVLRHGVINSLLHGGSVKKNNFGTLRRKMELMNATENSKTLERETIGFENRMHLVNENVKGGTAAIKVVHRIGAITGLSVSAFTVDYKTIDGDAEAGRKYVAQMGTLVFKPGEVEKTIEIEIIDNNIEEDDEFFTVQLYNLRYPNSNNSDTDVRISPTHGRTVVTILDDDKFGQIALAQSHISISEDCGSVEIVVVRKHGAKGPLKCKLKTENGSAVSPQDFAGFPPEGVEVEFKDGEFEKAVNIAIVDDEDFEKDEVFTVKLEPYDDSDAAAAAITDPKFMEVQITNNDQIRSVVERATKLFNVNRHRLILGKTVWAEQIWEAVRWPDKEDGVTAQVVHVILFFWKFIAALIPPTFWWGGRLAFVCALLFIAIVTAVIGDLASMFGCALGLSDAITAITFVALGTSLPDTFASRTAAIQDKTADAAIGNVTGSNAVNVYLGLGLPWMVASIYWRLEGPTCAWQEKYPDAIKDYSNGGFYVPAGDLGFTVGIFCGCAAVAFILLMWRRVNGAELGTGGPHTAGNAMVTLACGITMILLWIVFVVFSSLKVEGII